jgi:hypothetical protein
MIPNPEAGFRLQAGDVTYVFAEQAQIVEKGQLFESSREMEEMGLEKNLSDRT